MDAEMGKRQKKEKRHIFWPHFQLFKEEKNHYYHTLRSRHKNNKATFASSYSQMANSAQDKEEEGECYNGRFKLIIS